MNKYWSDGTFSAEPFDQDGWLKGEGLFETLRCEGNRIFALNRHMRRAITAGKELGIKIPHEDVILGGLRGVLGDSQLPLARLRLLFSADSFAISYESYSQSSHPIQVLLAPSPAQTIAYKTFPYRHRLHLLETATTAGCDEVLLSNADGFITEGAVSTFFFRDVRGWFTTPLSSGVLPGVMRALYLDNLDIQVRPLRTIDAADVQSAIAVSSLRLAQEVSSLGDRNLSCDEDSRLLIEKMHTVAYESSVVLAHG